MSKEKTSKRKRKRKRKELPLIILILLPMYRILSSPQRLSQSSRQTGVRCAAGSPPSTVRLLLVHAHCTVPRCRRRCWCCLSTGHVGSLGWGSWRRGLGLGCCRCSGSGSVRHRAGSGARCCRRWRWWRGSGCWSSLLFKIGFGCPALDRGGGVHAKPPPYAS